MRATPPNEQTLLHERASKADLGRVPLLWVTLRSLLTADLRRSIEDREHQKTHYRSFSGFTWLE